MQESGDNAGFEPPLPSIDVAADERTTLREMLDYYRAVLARKAFGLDAAQLHQPLAPSDLTIAGLLHHVAMAEDTWFTYRFLGEPPPEPWASADWDADEDWEITAARDLDATAIFAQYETSLARSRAAFAGADSLDQHSVRGREDGTRWNLRWIMVHMIEEYARHCGHADFIRQSIDGMVDD